MAQEARTCEERGKKRIDSIGMESEYRRPVRQGIRKSSDQDTEVQGEIPRSRCIGVGGRGKGSK